MKNLIGLIIATVCISCAHFPQLASNTKQVAPNEYAGGFELIKNPSDKPTIQTGIRPGKCVQPSMIFNGVAKRMDDSCSYLENGPAGCVYIIKVLAAMTFWGCGITMGQKNCKSEWIPLEMKCVLWDDKYEVLIPHNGE